MKTTNFSLFVLVLLAFSACRKESNDPYGQFVGKWNVIYESTNTIYYDLSQETRIIRIKHSYEYDLQFNRQFITKDSTGTERIGAWGYLPERTQILVLLNYTDTLSDGTISSYRSSYPYSVISVDANTQHWQIATHSSGNINTTAPGDTYSVDTIIDYYLTRQ